MESGKDQWLLGVEGRDKQVEQWGIFKAVKTF